MRRCSLLCLLLLVPLTALPDCMRNGDGDVICGKGQCQRDLHGVVMCSAHKYGSAVRTLDGDILCGKGGCVATLTGEYFCSDQMEGSALIDVDGVISCEGECEPASADMCEAVPAGTKTN